MVWSSDQAPTNTQRFTRDGCRGCSCPCEACRIALASFDAVVVCFGEKGEVIRERASEMSSQYRVLLERGE